MRVNYNFFCCGVREIGELSSRSDPKDALRAFGRIIYPDPNLNDLVLEKLKARAKALQRSWYGLQGPQNPNTVEADCVWEAPEQYSKFRYAIFTQAMPQNHEPKADSFFLYGEKFAQFILDNKLGEVTTTGTHVNPNSSYNLKVFVWAIDHDAVREWLAKDGSLPNQTRKGKSLWDETPAPPLSAPATSVDVTFTDQQLSWPSIAGSASGSRT